MRLVAGLLALTLTGSLAFAEEANAPEPKPEASSSRVSLRVVRVLPESHQALLYDKHRGTHVLADEGGAIDGYRVLEINEDEVVLSAEGREVVLAAPAPAPAPATTWRARRDRRGAELEARTLTPPSLGEAAPLDPYAPLDPGAPASAPVEGPLDPYAEPGVSVVAAPASLVPGDDGVRVVDASGAPPAPTATRPLPAMTTTPPAVTTTPSAGTTTPSAGTPALTPIVLSRSELNAALGDFGKLTSSLRGSFTPAGARLDVVAPTSVFGKAGLRAGDLVTAVDGAPLRTIEDAADLYIRAPSTRAANIQLIRAGSPLTLRVLLQ